MKTEKMINKDDDEKDGKLYHSYALFSLLYNLFIVLPVFFEGVAEVFRKKFLSHMNDSDIHHKGRDSRRRRRRRRRKRKSDDDEEEEDEEDGIVGRRSSDGKALRSQFIIMVPKSHLVGGYKLFVRSTVAK